LKRKAEEMTTNEMATLGGGAGAIRLASMSLGTQRQTRREVDRIQSRAVVAKLTEDARAMLANSALEHVGSLTALEQHLITVAPLGEARYREIVDSYTLGAAAEIRRWR
jgi:DNA-binding TFAR19-related protein (PDSD5 family)